MPYRVRILADSISPIDVRLTTMEVEFPRFILAEMNTHRMFSRNYASSRAIPVSRRIEMVRQDPVIPMAFGKNRPGMQATEEADDPKAAESVWVNAIQDAIYWAKELADLGVHKQLANRILEPFTYVTGIITATSWGNFFALRCHPDAQPEMRHIAEMMRDAYYASTPEAKAWGQWHVPLVDFPGQPNVDLTDNEAVRCSVARCARVSYNNHDGTAPDVLKDLELHDRLLASGHMSPFEHQARPSRFFSGNFFSGNFYGWEQYRKTLPGECRGYEWPPTKADE